jgi:hypothetical protein
VIALVATLAVVGVAHGASAASAACTVTDTSNPHFFNEYDSAQSHAEAGHEHVTVFSSNNGPCDQVGSDGDNEQGIGGAEMPLAGATCPYSQDVDNEKAGGGPVTVGHHGDDIYVGNNPGNLDVTWASGVDGQDPAATLAGQTCTGNGIVSDNAVTDPADCLDGEGANINILGNFHEDTDPLGIGTNDGGASGFTCLDAVDGNEWTFLTTGPFVGQTEDGVLVVGSSPEALVTVNPSFSCGVEVSDGPSDSGEPTTCLVTVDSDWVTDGALVGYSEPISGTIASGQAAEADGDS